MKHQKKKKNGPKAPKECEVSNIGDFPSDGEIMWMRLLEPFTSVSIDQAASAYREANGDLNRAAEILGNLGETAEDQSTTSSISRWYASSSSSELSEEDHCAQYRVLQKSKTKKFVASAGTVSTVLGKDYVSSLPKKQLSGQKKFGLESYSKEESEQFLCSMLGEECHLSLAVIRDVLCECGYDFYKALNILLELSSSSSFEQSDKREEGLLPPESNDNLTNKIFCSSYSSRSNIQEQMLYAGNPSRDQYKLLHEIERSSPPQGNSESQVSKDVLNSLFNVPTLKTVEHVPGNVKWRDVVTKMTSLGLNSEPSPASSVIHVHNYATKGEEYQIFREASTRHWESMKPCYQKAASAFSNGGRQYASYLADQGRTQNKKALEAEEKASQNIFEARNKSIENLITIDLHGQHVKQAMRLLKLHLLFGAYGRSVPSG
ncbi:unnamed protein product [Cuscuta epithymum]|uniref:DUF1771 domain-containing protein n=1 Tax=Cuscuta epithymum TaxID=186058 RepID=A0AAV0CJJ5_9ASTE|nr:unnamed protein product [Cuscuta epithymum]